jgi:hypothetical protein
MHEPITDHVEDYLTRSNGTSLPAEFSAHLVSCTECRHELASMELHSQIVRVLKPVPDVEPSAGFYARVLERIEAQRPISIWSIFLEPFGRRIAFASLALALLMGGYLVTTEPGDAPAASASYASGNEILPGEDQPGIVLGPATNTDREQDRGAVLVNLATYQEQ